MCSQCGNNYEWNWLVKAEFGNLQGRMLCQTCFRKYKNNGLIRKHDDKRYPDRIITHRVNIGHKIIDSFVFSTGVPEPIEEPRLYGVEVELELYLNGAIKEGVDRFQIAGEMLKHLGQDFIIVKEDGTLTTNGKYSDVAHRYGPTYAGFEVVSAAAPLSIHRDRWARLESFRYFHLLRAWDCDTCGFHIHLSRDAIENNLVGGRMLAFLNADENRKFIWKVAGRSEVAYTKYIRRKVSDFIKPELVVNPDGETPRDRSRRVALNLSNDHTVEMRIFRGTVNPRHIIRNIEFYDSLLEFCSPCSRSLGEIYDFRKYVKFVDVNRKRWPMLAAWFAMHEIIKLKKIKRPEKVDFAKLTLNVKDIPEPELIKV
jgi:hypothetical protein